MQDVEEKVDRPLADHSQETNTAIRETQQAVDASTVSTGAEKEQCLSRALDRLLVLEKQTRVSGDGENNTKVIVHMTRLCVQTAQWTVLVGLLGEMSKKRNLIKQAITAMVQYVMQHALEQLTGDTKMELINELRRITEGKIYVEVERARLIGMLAKMREAEGKVDEAAELLQEVQVETIGSMEAREKIEFILEQMRLCLDRGDFVRGYIVAKKVTRRTLQYAEHQDLKLRYYRIMIRYWIHKRDYFEICKSYYDIYDTPLVQQDPSQWVDALQHIVLYVVLSPFDNAQSDLMHRVWADRRLEERGLEAHREILRAFVNRELIQFPEFQQRFAAVLQHHTAYAQDAQMQSDLHDRIVENNVRIVASHYDRITTRRLSELLHLDADKTESFVSKMVSSSTISAKVDRIDGVVRFKAPQEPDQVLNDFSNDIVGLLGKINKATHLIEAVRATSGKKKPKSAKARK